MIGYWNHYWIGLQNYHFGSCFSLQRRLCDRMQGPTGVIVTVEAEQEIMAAFLLRQFHLHHLFTMYISC